MSWTFEQRIQRACQVLVDSGELEQSQIEHVKRPRFYGQYALGVGLSLKVNYWGEWLGVKDITQQRLSDLDVTMQSNGKTYQINVFSNNPEIIRRLNKHHLFYFNHVRIVDRNSWHLTLPRPKPKGKFYGEFGWRYEFKDPKWGLDTENVLELEKLGGPLKLVTVPRTFLYLDKLSDVLMLKLIAAEQLLSLDDRHEL